MYILSESSVDNAIQDELPDLQALITEKLGVRIRRIDRYIQLCLLGAINCSLHKPLPQNSSIILATGAGTVSTVAKIMETVFVSHYPPKPLHFVNSLGNSVCHFLSKILAVQGSSMAVSQDNFSFEAALIYASTQFATGTTSPILVGGTDEAPLPLEHQKERLGLGSKITHICEGSHWLVVSKSPSDLKGECIKICDPEYLDSVQELKVKLSAGIQDKKAITYFNYRPSDDELVFLNLKAENIQLPLEFHHPHPVYSGRNIVSAVQKMKAGKVNKAYIVSYDAKADRFCLTVLTLN